MAPSQTEIESRVIELAEKSFKTFCGDISGMFGVDTVCSRQQVGPETLNGLKTRFKDFVLVYSVKAEGELDGTFQLVFDPQGLFILAGVVAMHPEHLILEDVKSASLEKAQQLGNILTEVGDALVGAWDRVFGKALDGHDRFVQTNTFIGSPWDNSEKKIGLAGDEDFMFVPYEMTVGPCPTFKCGVIFPKAILAGTSESESETPNVSEEEKEAESKAPNVSEEVEEIEEKAQDQKTAVDKADSDESDTAQKSDSEKSKPQEPADEKAAEEKTKVEKNTKEAPQAEGYAVAEKAKPAAKEAVVADKSAAEQEPEATTEEERPVDAAEGQPEAATEEERPVAAAEEERPVAAAEKERPVAATEEERPVDAAEGQPEADTEGESEAAPEDKPEDATEGQPEAAAEQGPEATTDQKPEADTEGESEAAAEQGPEATTDQKPEAAAEGRPEAAPEDKPEDATEGQPEAATEGQPEAAAEQGPEAAAEQRSDDVNVKAPLTDETDKSEKRTISETIQKMARSSAVLPGEPTPSVMAEKLPLGSEDALLAVCAKDIMQKNVIWVDPEDSVQKALATIQQRNGDYMMIGRGKIPEGVVSKSDLTGALSPYLRPTFSKWRRPMDDATLQIKVKWIMSKPTCTVTPETPLTAMMEHICKAGKLCLPVVDQQGKVQGLVTVFDIFNVLLKSSHRS